MNQSVKELLQETLEKYGISRARAGREMGYSSSIVSAYMTGNYSGDVVKLEKTSTNGVTDKSRLIAVKRFQLWKQLRLRQS